MIGLEIDDGKYRLEYDGDELCYNTRASRTAVCDNNIKAILLSLMRENISMKAKFTNMLMLSNTATRARAKEETKR